MPPTTVGPPTTKSPVGLCQTSTPSEALTAYTLWSAVPTNTIPLPTAGPPSTTPWRKSSHSGGHDVGAPHPVVLYARRWASSDPTNTRPLMTAGSDRMSLVAPVPTHASCTLAPTLKVLRVCSVGLKLPFVGE